MTQYYLNTPERRASLGLDRLPEHVSGDPALPLIAHDARAGRFAYLPARPDRRYSVRREFVGLAEPRYAVRFCGELVGHHATSLDAVLAALAHGARRTRTWWPAAPATA